MEPRAILSARDMQICPKQHRFQLRLPRQPGHSSLSSTGLTSVARIDPRSFIIHPRFTQRRDEKLTSSRQSFDFSVTNSAPRTFTVVARSSAFNPTREEHHGQDEKLDESHGKSQVAIAEGRNGRRSYGRSWAVGRGQGRIWPGQL